MRNRRAPPAARLPPGQQHGPQQQQEHQLQQPLVLRRHGNPDLLQLRISELRSATGGRRPLHLELDKGLDQLRFGDLLEALERSLRTELPELPEPAAAAAAGSSALSTAAVDDHRGVDDEKAAHEEEIQDGAGNDRERHHRQEQQRMKRAGAGDVEDGCVNGMAEERQQQPSLPVVEHPGGSPVVRDAGAAILECQSASSAAPSAAAATPVVPVVADPLPPAGDGEGEESDGRPAPPQSQRQQGQQHHQQHKEQPDRQNLCPPVPYEFRDLPKAARKLLFDPHSPTDDVLTTLRRLPGWYQPLQMRNVLLRAIRLGDPEMTLAVVERCPFPSLMDAAPILNAVFRRPRAPRLPSCLRILVQAGFPVLQPLLGIRQSILKPDGDAEGSLGTVRTLLQMSARAGCSETLGWLLSLGADPDTGLCAPVADEDRTLHLERTKFTPLEFAVRYARPNEFADATGHFECIRALVDAGASLHAPPGGSHQSLVHHAAISAKHPETLRFCVHQLELDVDTPSRVNGLTALQSVVRLAPRADGDRDQLEVVKTLLELGADPWRQDTKGRNLLMATARHDQVRMAEVVLEHWRKGQEQQQRPQEVQQGQHLRQHGQQQDHGPQRNEQHRQNQPDPPQHGQPDPQENQRHDEQPQANPIHELFPHPQWLEASWRLGVKYRSFGYLRWLLRGPWLAAAIRRDPEFPRRLLQAMPPQRGLDAGKYEIRVQFRQIRELTELLQPQPQQHPDAAVGQQAGAAEILQGADAEEAQEIDLTQLEQLREG